MLTVIKSLESIYASDVEMDSGFMHRGTQWV